MPPGPRPRLPWTTFTQLRRDPLLFLTQLTQTYGDISSFSSLGRRYVVLNHPDLAKEVLLTQADAFWKGPALQNSKGILGEGLLTAEGETHKCQRRIMQPAFHAKRVEAYVPDILSCTRALCTEWEARGNHLLDIRPAMMRLTLLIAGRTLFGTLLDEETALVERSMEVLMGNYRRTVVPWGKLLNALPLPSTLRLQRARRNLTQLVSQMIDARSRRQRGPHASRSEPHPHSNDLLSALLAANDPDSNSPSNHQPTRLTDQQVRDQAITILTAGHETTANAMTFTLYLLAKYPAQQDTLREHIRQVLGDREPNAADLEQLEPVRRVLAESMRLLPPAWTLGRETQRPVEIAGYRIPPKTTFLIPQWTMHRDERFFPNPLEFQPDRWQHPTHPRFAYLPFSTGPRNCIGESFAWIEMLLALSMLLTKFQFTLHNASTELSLVPAITLRPRESVHVRVHTISTR